ncbi:MAG: hypothetical protein Q9M50_10520 [Methylococcales bacterium]|nr:hypothetical protein [Methylococcales bacterium]
MIKELKYLTFNLLFSLSLIFLGDAKQCSLAGIRRSIMDSTAISISRGAFWERLAGNRLNKIMRLLVEELMSNTVGTALYDSNILGYQLKAGHF